ncbi:AAA family ATPase [Microvirga sp. M2]|uniref:bifunctional aminoglycoside phosphotransferase/ATP-binding protein n=1 Tax=Microvirga sp. M2 TaxID=3073270 RepID=UPI0039C10F56
MIVDEQNETVQFLKGLLGERSPVEVMTTHASMIFLAEGKAYKLKRAVRFPYLDYSTAQQRYTACLAEFSLNHRAAPELYMGVRAVTREADGRLALDGAGALVDALVEMHRFDQECLFDRMAQQGSLTPAIVSDLAHRIAAFHREAPASLDHGGVSGMAGVLDINERSLRATRLVPDDIAIAFSQKFRRILETHSDVLERRRLAGRVRRCHGDLILRNICLWRGVPTLFDCLEFNDDLATIDVLYDLAFLLMDLWHRNQQQSANTLLNRYLDETDETDGLGLVPFFMAIRAAVRAHVTAAQAEHASPNTIPSLLSEARQYFDLAGSLLTPVPAALVAIGGLSGTGKSTIASLVAPHLGAVPGARILNSDRIRKQRYGVPVQSRLPESAYRPELSEQVYATVRQEAGRALHVGSAVIADAVFDRPLEREKLEQLAAGSGIPFTGYWLQAPMEVLISRVEARQKDPSDATADVVRMQAGCDCGTIDWIRLDASQEAATIKDGILQRQGIGRTTSLSQDARSSPEAMKPP